MKKDILAVEILLRACVCVTIQEAHQTENTQL